MKRCFNIRISVVIKFSNAVKKYANSILNKLYMSIPVNRMSHQHYTQNKKLVYHTLKENLIEFT
jgi:hypothetical protein